MEEVAFGDIRIEIKDVTQVNTTSLLIAELYVGEEPLYLIDKKCVASCIMIDHGVACQWLFVDGIADLHVEAAGSFR